MLEYNPHFNPPAPILAVTLSSLTNGEQRKTLPALIDTGSDITVIPREFVEQFQLLPVIHQDIVL
jgi:predicted aspartyl protease